MVIPPVDNTFTFSSTCDLSVTSGSYSNIEFDSENLRRMLMNEPELIEFFCSQPKFKECLFEILHNMIEIDTHIVNPDLYNYKINFQSNINHNMENVMITEKIEKLETRFEEEFENKNVKWIDKLEKTISEFELI